MKEENIEDFIVWLDGLTKNMCVYPNKQTFECCDCYICRFDYFNKIREDLKNKHEEY